MDIKTLKQQFLSDRYGSRRAARDIPKTVLRMSEFTEAIQDIISCCYNTFLKKNNRRPVRMVIFKSLWRDIIAWTTCEMCWLTKLKYFHTQSPIDQRRGSNALKQYIFHTPQICSSYLKNLTNPNFKLGFVLTIAFECESMKFVMTSIHNKSNLDEMSFLIVPAN